MSMFVLPEFIRCPHCAAKLSHDGGSLFCSGERRHTYDIAKEGYVNLLPPGRAKNAHTGDDADMIKARERFLSGKGYDRYSREAAELVSEVLLSRGCPHGAVLIDAGCGEGRHTVNMANTLRGAINAPVTAAGFDASKFGVRAAAKRYVKKGEGLLDGVDALFAAANIFSLPVSDGCADVLSSLFAPLPEDEARRVLRRGGILLICAAGEGHLGELRQVLYDNPIPSGGGAPVPAGFTTVREKLIEYPLELSSSDEIMSLFTMTPFYYNAPAEGRKRLEELSSVTVTVQVKCTVAVKD